MGHQSESIGFIKTLEQAVALLNKDQVVDGESFSLFAYV